jgi:hypothetical protein
MTEEQERALDHARHLLEEDTDATLGNPAWHRMCRLALQDILAAFEGELP